MEPEQLQEPTLVASRIQVDYPGREAIVSGVDISLSPGEVVALLGPNGAGKTTLLRALSGVVRPSNGTVKVTGLNLFELSASDRARLVSYLPQGGVDHGPFTVEQIVMFGRFAHGEGRIFEGEEDRAMVENALETFDLEDFRMRRLHELSGGERQRVHLARLMCQDAQVVLVDEPATALDPRHQREILSLLCAHIRGRGYTILLTLHDPNLAADFADRLVYILDGEVQASGAPSEMLNPQILKEIYGLDYTVMQHPGDHRPVVVPTHRGKIEG